MEDKKRKKDEKRKREASQKVSVFKFSNLFKIKQRFCVFTQYAGLSFITKIHLDWPTMLQTKGDTAVF